MASPSDERVEVSRGRLCEVAKVDRGKHRRWLDDDLLPVKKRYGLIDVLHAALLDELNARLKPKAARTVWRRIRDEIGIPGHRLDLVVDLSTNEPILARTDRQISAAIPRGERVMVLDLGGRARLAYERLDAYLHGERGTSGRQEGDDLDSRSGRGTTQPAFRRR